MALHLRTAGWKALHPARVARRPAVILLVAGALSLLAGASLLLASLAPMWGIGPETSTVAAQPAAAPPDLDTSGASALTNSLGNASNAAISMVDRPVNGVDFTMKVPALGYSATVYEGTDEKTLLKGPGHYPFTPWPGHVGNVAIAAHNVYWLSFSRLKAGDRVELITRRGTFLYAITGSKVVNPDDRTILVQTADHRLTLTTCYPLWAGAFATQRLIFFAKEIGGVG